MCAYCMCINVIGRLAPRNRGRQKVGLASISALALGVLLHGISGCAPEYLDVVPEVPPRQPLSSKPYEVQEFDYIQETPPEEAGEVDPCRALLDELRVGFARVYRDAGMPRVAFRSSAAGYHRAVDGQGTPITADPLRLDQAVVENHITDVFQSLSRDLVVIDLSVAGDQLGREGAALAAQGSDEVLLAAARDRNLCDILVLVELRLAKMAKLQVEVGVWDWTDVSSWGVVRKEREREEKVELSQHAAVCCTAKAVRVEDGTILTTAVPGRYHCPDDEAALGEVLRQLSLCTAADLAEGLYRKLAGDARMPVVTVRVIKASSDQVAFQLMEWIEEQFPGSNAAFRSYSEGTAEFSVSLNGRFGDFLSRIQGEDRPADLELDVSRSGARTVTFKACAE